MVSYPKKYSELGGIYRGIPLVHNEKTNAVYLLEDVGTVVRVLPEHHPIKANDMAQRVERAKKRALSGNGDHMALTMHKPPQEHHQEHKL